MIRWWGRLFGPPDHEIPIDGPREFVYAWKQLREMKNEDFTTRVDKGIGHLGLDLPRKPLGDK